MTLMHKSILSPQSASLCLALIVCVYHRWDSILTEQYRDTGSSTNGYQFSYAGTAQNIVNRVGEIASYHDFQEQEHNHQHQLPEGGKLPGMRSSEPCASSHSQWRFVRCFIWVRIQGVRWMCKHTFSLTPNSVCFVTSGGAS
jgi:hypothetical protein